MSSKIPETMTAIAITEPGGPMVLKPENARCLGRVPAKS